MFFVVVCDIHRRSFLPFSHLIIHPIQEMIWILTTIPSLIRRLQWWIAVLLLFEGRQRVAPFYHPSIHQISTLEKAKLCHRPTLSSLVSTSFRQIVCGGGLPRDLRHGKQQVAPFYHLYQLSHSKDFWLPWLTFPRLSHAENDRVEAAVARRLIIGLDFAVTLSSPESYCVFCCHPFRTNCGTKMADVEQTQKMIPFVTCAISFGGCQQVGFWCRCTKFGSLGPNKLDRITNQVQLCGFWDHVSLWDLLPLMIILITASLFPNTHDKASWCEDWTFEGTRSTLFKTLIIPRDCWLGAWLVLLLTTGFTVLHGSDSCFQGLKQSDHTNRVRESRPISIQRPKRDFRILLNCVKLKLVSYTSNL